MTTWLKQSATVTIALGPFVDSTDGFTSENGLTIAQADVLLSKNAGAWAQKNSTTAPAYMTGSNGFYSVELNATDTGTAGLLSLSVSESGALPVFREFMVIPVASYNAIIGGTTSMNSNVTQWGSVDVATTNPITESIIEGSLSIKNVLRLNLAALAGKVSGMATTSVAFRDQADTKNRISATVDTSGNRTAVTVDGS